MKLLIGADIVPTQSNLSAFETGNTAELIDDALWSRLSEADFRIFNLEIPLTDQETPIQKCGPNLIASVASVKGIKAVGADFVTLANNHILDQGEQGLCSTMKTLDEVEINYAGAGDSPAQAAEPYILEREGKRIGIYCCAEHEFSIVTDYSAGANPFDPLESLDHIAALSAKCDYVIVLYHGGKEHYRYPSPYLQKVCRKIVDKGADLVVCQHSHCIGCKEKWSNGTIVYGQGNFLFGDYDVECWRTSLLVELELHDQMSIRYIPLVKSGAASVALAQGEAAARILSEFEERSQQIIDSVFVQKAYQQISDQVFSGYLRRLQGKRYSSIPFRILNKLSRNRLIEWVFRKKYGSAELSAILNTLDCEAHRESFLNALYRRMK